MAPRNTKLIKGNKGKMLQDNDAKMKKRAEDAKTKIFKNLANPDGGKTGMGLDDEKMKTSKKTSKKKATPPPPPMRRPSTPKELMMKEGSGISGKNMDNALDSNVQFGTKKLMAGGKVKKMMGGGMLKPKKMMGGGMTKIKYRGGGIVQQGARPTKYI